MADDGVSAQVPIEVLRQLLPAAEAMGLSLPGVARFATSVDVTMPIRNLALELGRLCSVRNIFLKGRRIVTVDEKTGEEAAMTATRFVGWIEEFTSFKSGARSQRMRDSLTREDASLIIDQDIFRSCLRPLEAVHKMRLPVRRAPDADHLWAGKIEFLESGYDAQSRIFTADVIRYEMDWPLERARTFLDEHGDGYPWNWGDEPQGTRPVCMNRSWSVIVAAMVGMYCRAFFPAGTTRPMLAGLGNQPGTGKSTVVAMVTMPVHGHASTNKIPKDDGEMDKELDTIAMNARPYVFFDDIGGGMFSHPLNAFITAESRTGRALGGNTEFFAPQVCQVFATGNDIKISADLMRRALIFELFLAGDVRGRKFPRIITPRYLAAVETRKQFLAALCAVVRHTMDFVGNGGTMPTVEGLESFDEWTRTVSQIARLAGYADPLAPPDLATGGSEDEDEMRELLVKVASAAEGDGEFDRKELVEMARNFGLLEPLVGAPGDKDLDLTAMKRWGRQLQKWRGRELMDAQGRRFRFSHKRQKRGAKYPLTFIKPKASADAGAS